MKTEVIFKKDKFGVFAVFPYEICNSNLDVTSYAHVGQHGACSLEYMRECKNATPNEFKDLLQELKSIGYDLEIKQRYNHSKFLKAVKSVKRV